MGDEVRACNKEMSGGEGQTDHNDDDSSIELNLSLSLGGRFGVDKTPRKLERSSTVIGNNSRNKETVAEKNPESYAMGLTRTTSLPAEIEEEWRKRKELQSMRRLEAKRRRCAKLSCAENSDDNTAPFLSERQVSSNKQVFDETDARVGSSSNLSDLVSLYRICNNRLQESVH